MTDISKPTAIAHEASELIGNTPLLRLKSIPKQSRCPANIFCKMESMNPLASVKDRIARSMIARAEAAHKITPAKSVLIEVTSGNTGIALAFIAASKGYRLILVMPDGMSVERRIVCLSLGAELVLVDGGVVYAMKKADELAAEIPHAFLLRQFSNPDNPRAHYETTGPEIASAIRCDAFVAGVGTGGTITGTGRFLKEVNPDVHIIAVEPSTSPVLAGGEAGEHGITGIGAGIIPEVLDTFVYDEIAHVSTEESVDMARRLAREEGVFCGVSSGAAVAAAIRIGKRPRFDGKNVVVIIPSFGERYLSTPLFEAERSKALSLISH